MRLDDAGALSWATTELVRLVEIPSVSDEEHEIAAYIADRMEGLGFPVQLMAVPGAGPNLLIGWSDQPTLLLTAHTDTIAPSWTRDGAARVDGTVVHGLGAQDDKGGVVACLLALVLARDAGVPLEDLGVAVGLCVDEEVGGKGSRAMAAALSPPFVVALEGTELQVATVEAGYVEGWVTVHGKTAHHSWMEEGDNAIDRAADLIVECRQAPFTRFVHPIASANRVSVHAISSPAAINVVPESATFFMNARIFGPTPPAEVAAELQAICARHNATFRLDEESRWFETPTDAPLARALAAAVRTVVGDVGPFAGMNAWTDAHSFVEIAHSQTVVFGPGHLRSAHGPLEHIDVREVVLAARILATLLADVPALVGAPVTQEPG